MDTTMAKERAYQERRRRRCRDRRRHRRGSGNIDVRSKQRRDRSQSRERIGQNERSADANSVVHDGNNHREPHEHSAVSVVDTHGHAPVEQQGEKLENVHSGRPGGSARRSKGKLAIPDNWVDVPKIGTLIASSRFVAMRVPLDEKFTCKIRSSDEIWTPQIFLQTQASSGHDVRLLIDLTNTAKYYDGQAAFHNTGVQYVKLCIQGFKAPPREWEVEAFLRIVDEFTAAEPQGSIAVHCTHGLNRTGYLVVSYLVRRAGMSVQDALKAFSDARPPGLIKHMYIEDLYRRFAPDATIELPELPEWAVAKYAARRR